MARPTKYGEPLAKPRSFRLPESVDAKFEGKLTASGMEQSEFIRDHVFREVPRIEVIARPSKKERHERRMVLAAINRVGNNINQIAHRMNAANLAGKVSDDLADQVLYELEVISTFLNGSIAK